MKRVYRFVLPWTLFFSGCACPSFVKSVDGHTTTILPAYIKYVETDASLDPGSKRIRIRSAEQFQQLVDEAKKANKL